MRILSLDLGDFNAQSAWNFFDDEGGEIGSGVALTTEPALRDLIDAWSPDIVLCEACLLTHLAVDAGASAQKPCRVIAANTNADAWRWSKTKVKTDQKDCERLIKLFRLGELDEVFIPDAPQREMRRLITHRGNLVAKRAGAYNAIRSLCKRHQVLLPSGDAAWSQQGLRDIFALTLSARWTKAVTCTDPDIWRMELQHHLMLVRLCNKQIKEVERVINQALAQSPLAKVVQTAPGIGPHIAAALMAFIGSAQRFPSGKHIASYLGLVPRIYQSGKSERHGGITKAGNQRLRKLLINGTWQAIRFNPWAKELFERLTGGSDSKVRRKKAIVAVARRLVIRCWAMMRDETAWKPRPTPTGA